MAIQPPSDIVFDVAVSADPVRQNAAVRKLSEAGTSTENSSFKQELQTFSSTVDSSIAAISGYNMSMNSHLTPFSHSKQQSSNSADKTAVNFEAVLLQNSIEEMMPSSKSFFGTGTAGSVWKSMLSQQLAQQMAQNGILGVADAVKKSIASKLVHGSNDSQKSEKET